MQIGMATFFNAKTYKCKLHANKEGETSLLKIIKKILKLVFIWVNKHFYLYFISYLCGESVANKISSQDNVNQ